MILICLCKISNNLNRNINQDNIRPKISSKECSHKTNTAVVLNPTTCQKRIHFPKAHTLKISNLMLNHLILHMILGLLTLINLERILINTMLLIKNMKEVAMNLCKFRCENEINIDQFMKLNYYYCALEIQDPTIQNTFKC